MSTIKVTPEQLLHVSKQIEQARQQLAFIRSDLTARISFIETQWAGATQERFFYDFQQSRPILNRALESMVKSSQYLMSIAERFQKADQEQVSAGAMAGLIAMKKNEANTSRISDKPEYTMVYDTERRRMVPTDKDGNVTPETVRAYERDAGSLDMRSGPDFVPEGEDNIQYQVDELKNGVYPFSGEFVSENRAKLLIFSLQASNMLMAFTGIYNRGYKVPKDGQAFTKSKLNSMKDKSSSSQRFTSEHGTKLTQESTNAIGNSAVLNTIKSRSKFYKKELAYDCSEIADDLAQAAGGKGEIFTIKSRTEFKDIQVKEYGEMKSYVYHTVYSDGKYIYDPRLTNDPVPIKEYMDSVSRHNNGDIVVSKRTLK